MVDSMVDWLAVERVDMKELPRVYKPEHTTGLFDRRDVI